MTEVKCNRTECKHNKNEMCKLKHILIAKSRHCRCNTDFGDEGI